ncbi:MAG: hypothetical protein NTX82_00345 [Candidatus Parcubacteria bacterium]|nr:hypothetical protein [Candidatus Parcubacteria bacterium]
MFKKILLIAVIGVLGITTFASAATLAQRLNGTILLQVEANGEAWYINPTDNMRYYMKDGAVAYQMMRNFGLGITDADLAKIPSVSSTSEMNSSSSICLNNTTTNRLKGKILLQVQQHGEAWYIYPKTCRRIYMKDGEAAYGIMRFLGLGITNKDLSLINVNESFNNTASSSETTPTPLPKSDPVSTPPTQTTASKIPGLATIRVSGGVWENWDADAEKDGPNVEIVYLDSTGGIITDNSTEQLPISADVKVFTKDMSTFPWKEGRLVFSAHYSQDQIISGSFTPKIRIPKEELSVNPAVDYKYGYVSITIHTPEQGDFSDVSDFVVLYE